MPRSNATYPVQLPLHYRMREGDPVRGEGRTLTMGRATLRFSCDRTLPLGARIQLVVAWPAQLPDGTGLNVWIVGKITGCAAGHVDVGFDSYEFRTRPPAYDANTPRGRASLWRMIG